MRKLLIASLFLPLLALAGCGTLGSILTGGVANPLTPARALSIHAAFDGGVVVAAGNYAALPRCPAPQPCSSQQIVNTLRTYVNSAESALNKLDAWALGNSSLDAAALYQGAMVAVQTAQEYAAKTGLQFQKVN